MSFVGQVPSTLRSRVSAHADRIMAWCGIGLSLGLIPTLLNTHAVVPLWSSIPTTILLAVMALVFWARSWKVSFLTQTVTTLLWLLIALLRHG